MANFARPYMLVQRTQYVFECIYLDLFLCVGIHRQITQLRKLPPGTHKNVLGVIVPFSIIPIMKTITITPAMTIRADIMIPHVMCLIIDYSLLNCSLSCLQYSRYFS